MKKKYLLLPFLLFFIISSAVAQERSCGMSDPEFYGIEINDAYHRRIQDIENFTSEWIADQSYQVQTRNVISIPVVIHILYTDETENFSDHEIESQIDGLTADFRQLNNNTSIIPPMFRNLAADTEIEFCIANINPDGEVKRGIVRRQTNLVNIGTPSGGQLRICHDSLGGSDAWDAQKYINIWVGQIEFEAGRATFPGQTTNLKEDGIWIDPAFFGFFCSSDSDFHLGRTLTHEMGHFLNLFHTWGEGGCGSNDMVDDTPAQDSFYKNCPTHPQETCGSVDMFMNFMDYVDDDCMAMFTEGQKARMLATLANPGARQSLTASIGCGWEDGVNRTLSSDDINIFPNPARDCVHIDLDLDNDLPIRMGIFNTLGQAIFTSSVFVKDLRTFDISHLSNGVYFIYFESRDQVASKKLVVDR